LGADMGIVCPISYSIFGTKIRGEIGSREDFLVQRKRLSRRREQIHKGLTQTSGGKGRKHKLKKLNHYTEKERRFVNYKNHCYSKELISIALRNGCGTIHIEDLEGIGREVTNKFILRNWSYFELQMMIKNKAKKEGIVVVKVNREYTSQRCSVCGNINKDNRIEQDRFVCTKCGFTENADYNASQNICIAETAEFKKQVVEHKKWLKENKLEDSDSDNDVFGVKIENKKINKKNKNKVVQLNS
jgi:IS605 OrfB family transposase